MKHHFFKLAILVVTMFFVSNLQNIFAMEVLKTSLAIESLCREDTPDSESILLTSLEDLYFDQENIILNVEGCPRLVNSLQKVNNQWIAHVADSIIYCPRGHVSCKHCHQCHISWCSYYVRPCKQWDR